MSRLQPLAYAWRGLPPVRQAQLAEKRLGQAEGAHPEQDEHGPHHHRGADPKGNLRRGCCCDANVPRIRNLPNYETIDRVAASGSAIPLCSDRSFLLQQFDGC